MYVIVVIFFFKLHGFAEVTSVLFVAVLRSEINLNQIVIRVVFAFLVFIP